LAYTAAAAAAAAACRHHYYHRHVHIADEIADNASSASRLIIKQHEIIPRSSNEGRWTLPIPKSPKTYERQILCRILFRHLEN